MDNLVIEQTPETPEINFNASTGALKIKGRAYANNISTFFKGLDLWLAEYLKKPNKITTIELELEYYNSIFIKSLLHFIKHAITSLKDEKKLVIKWKHPVDDDESTDNANRISKIINFPIEIIEID